MGILVTNDDSVNSPALWRLVAELSQFARVTVVAPSQEQSAIGTAVSLRQIVKVHKVEPRVPGIETYAVDGTPSDSVILALGKLVKEPVTLVVSGINQGTNLGEDVLISGTVGAAMQAYLRGKPAMAVSAPYKEGRYLDTAASVAGILARKIIAHPSLGEVFINVNLPEATLTEIRGAKITRLASESHINWVEEGGNGEADNYRLVRQGRDSDNPESDVWAVNHGNISITPLYTRRFDKSSIPVLKKLCSELVEDLKALQAIASK